MTGKRQRARQLAERECIRCQRARGFAKNEERLCLACQFPDKYTSGGCLDCGRDMVVLGNAVGYCIECGARRFIPGYAANVDKNSEVTS
jgi:hypothetical protein